jgi:hypothetical protein
MVHYLSIARLTEGIVCRESSAAIQGGVTLESNAKVHSIPHMLCCILASMHHAHSAPQEYKSDHVPADA